MKQSELHELPLDGDDNTLRCLGLVCSKRQIVVAIGLVISIFALAKYITPENEGLHDSTCKSENNSPPCCYDGYGVENNSCILCPDFSYSTINNNNISECRDCVSEIYQNSSCYFFTRIELCQNQLKSFSGLFEGQMYTCYESIFGLEFFLTSLGLSIFMWSQNKLLTHRTHSSSPKMLLSLFDIYLKIFCGCSLFSGVFLFLDWIGAFSGIACYLQNVEGFWNKYYISIVFPLMTEIAPLRLLMLSSLSKRSITKVAFEAAYVCVLVYLCWVVEATNISLNLCEPNIIIKYQVVEHVRSAFLFLFWIFSILVAWGKLKIRATGRGLSITTLIHCTYIAIDRIYQYALCHGDGELELHITECQNRTNFSINLRNFLNAVMFLIITFVWVLTLINESHYWRNAWRVVLRGELSAVTDLQQTSLASTLDYVNDFDGLIDASDLKTTEKIATGRLFLFERVVFTSKFKS